MTASPYDDSADEGVPDVDGSEFRYPYPYDSLEFAATTLGYTSVLLLDLGEFTLFELLVGGINLRQGSLLYAVERRSDWVRSHCEKGSLSASNISFVSDDDNPRRYSGTNHPTTNCLNVYYNDGSITYDIDYDRPGRTRTVSATAEGPFFANSSHTRFSGSTGYTGSIEYTTSTLQDDSHSISITSPSFESFAVQTPGLYEEEADYTKYEYEERDKLIINNLSYTEKYDEGFSNQSYSYEKIWNEYGRTFLLTLDVNDLVSDENGNTTGEVIFDLRVQDDNARFVTGHIIFNGNEATIHYNKEGIERSVTVPQWK
jgi:hypothetical protein